MTLVTLPTAGNLDLDGTLLTTAGRSIDASDLSNLTFTPAPVDSGTGYASFTFKVNDGTADSASAYTMTIDARAAVPVQVELVQTAVTVEEGQQVPLQIRITSSNRPTLDSMQVRLLPEAGTATDADYVLPLFSIRIGISPRDFTENGAGDWVATETAGNSLRIVDDAAEEDAETFQVSISAIQTALIGGPLILAAFGPPLTVTIPANDEPVVPAAPTNLRTTTVRALEVQLAWDAVAGADSYQYRVQDPEGTWSAWTDQTGSGASTFVRGLAPASAYGFQVRAVNSGGTGGAASATLAVTTGTLSWTVATDETGYTEGDDITVTVSAVVANYVNVTDCPSSVPLYLALDVSDPDGALSNAATRSLTIAGCQSSKTETFATVDDNTEEDDAAVTFTLALGSGGSTPHLSGTLGATPPSALVTVADKVAAPTGGLVSNTGQTHDASPNINHSAAQQFRTGSEAAGYDLDSVGYWIVTKDNNSALTVTLRASVSGTPDVPGDVVHTFTSPTLVADSLNVFTAPDGATLSADTDYFLVMEETAGAITMRATASAAEDTDSHTGFSIADTRLWCSTECGSSGWNSASVNVLQIIVDGETSATDPDGPNNEPTGLPTITGTAQVGQTLTANTSGIGDADGLGTFAYQWIRGAAANIAGATGLTYGPVAADVGATLKVRVSWTDGAGTAESLTSAPTAPVTAAAANSPPTGVPTITGTPQVGRTLTANTSGIGDADGLGTFAYQWVRGAAANIAGATGSTYRPVAADIGHTLKVRVSWTDGGGTAESLTSAPTAAVTDSIRPKLLFSGGLAETEGSGEASVWAIVQPASSEYISFRVHTSDYALAEAGRDYVALDRIVTIPAGETYAAFPVRLIDDSIAEHHEQFTITVSQVRGAELHYARYAGGGVWGPDGHGPHGRISDVIEIRDDDGGDAAVITLMTLHEPRRAPEVVEGGVIEIMVNRRGGPDTGDVSVTVNVAESGGDRVASGEEGRRTVTLERGFENAQYRSTYYLRIPTRATGGGDGRLVVTVEDGTGYTVGEQSRVTVKLIDRAAPTPTVTLRASRNSAPEGEDLEFTLTRTGAVEEEVHVGVEVSETGHLVTGYPSLVRIEGGERSATFTVETLNDPDSGTGSVVTVSLTEDAERYRLGGPSSATVTVTDARSSNQAARLPEVSISAAAQSAAEGAALTFTLTSTEAAEAELAVGLEVSESGAMLAAYPVRVVIPAGAASATFDILTLNDETDETDSVVTVSIAEDGETYETGDPSSVSVSVTVTDDDEAAATPLTAESQDAPAAHNGVDAFTFRIAFSEAVAVSYRTLRDQALEVTGGRVTRAKRVDGRSDLWEITIAPDGDGGVNVVLPVTGSCDADGAVCTGDGGMLSNRTELTVPGPVAEEEKPSENSPATGAPGITGTAQVGETLTADTSGIADADGLDNAAFGYQWLADDAAISGATSSTYTLADADEGKAIRVRVSFTDDAGNQETPDQRGHGSG